MEYRNGPRPTTDSSRCCSGTVPYPDANGPFVKGAQWGAAGGPEEDDRERYRFGSVPPSCGAGTLPTLCGTRITWECTRNMAPTP